jgi:hypothetical protein
MNYCHVSFIITFLLKQKETRWRHYFSITLCIWACSGHYALHYTFIVKVSTCCNNNLLVHVYGNISDIYIYIGNKHTAEPLAPEPSASEVELAIEKLKSHKSPGIDQIPAELI